MDAKEDIMQYEPVRLDEEKDELIILDQTCLPYETKLLHLRTQEEIRNAIYLLQVRGAPAIGVAAAYGIYLAAKDIETDDYDLFKQQFHKAQAYLASARPTAVNLCWALERMAKVVERNADKPIKNIIQSLHNEAIRIRDEDIAVCRAIGEHGLTLLKDGQGILTHCNAGQLATSRYGTALAPIHLGQERGMRFRVFADETRPLLQGARLTCYELVCAGVDTTLICDNMASMVMKNGLVNAVLVGCDRVAANGDTANKIGTSGVAILAKHYNIPFYVCAPTSTIDLNCKSGEDIHIEERPEAEVTEMWYKRRMAPEGVKVYNPAFDVTEAGLITAFITEHGILRPPFEKALREVKARSMYNGMRG